MKYITANDDEPTNDKERISLLMATNRKLSDELHTTRAFCALFAFFLILGFIKYSSLIKDIRKDLELEINSLNKQLSISENELENYKLDISYNLDKLAILEEIIVITTPDNRYHNTDCRITQEVGYSNIFDIEHAMSNDYAPCDVCYN